MGHVRKQVITLCLTTKCNMSCIYCYAYKGLPVDKNDQVLDINFAKKGIDDFFRDYPSRHIRFYSSGEPTLEFDLMKNITNYAKKKAGKNLIVELQSNGIFSNEVRDWISDNVNILWISCDGPSKIQDYQRPAIDYSSSSEIVEKNIKFFVLKQHIQLGVRTTLCSNIINKQMEIINYFNSLGIKYINVHPACVSVEDDRHNVFNWDPIEFAENFLKTHNAAKKLGIFYNTLYITNFDEKTRHACRSTIPYPQLTTDGYVSCCDFGLFGPKYSSEALQQLIYGKYNEKNNVINYDEEKIYKIRSRCAENLEKTICKECEYLCHCSGGCLGQVVNETGNIMGLHEKNCKITKYLAKRMILNKELHPVIHS